MAKQNDFVSFVLQLLAPLGEVRARAMFGGYGVYHNELIFACVIDDTLYLKVDDETKEKFIARGLKPFTYDAHGKKVAMSYYEAPPEIFDDPDEMLNWARQAVVVSKSGKQKKKTSKKK